VTESARRLATYADLLALPAEVHAEILEGEIVVAPSPTPLHQATVGGVFAELRAPFQRGRGGPGGWWLIQDVDDAFGAHDVLRPDVSGWRRDRLRDLPTERPIPTLPDWVCEGLSPSTAVIDQGAKRAVYQRSAVPWYWIVDPLNRTITVYQLAAGGYLLAVTASDTGTARLPPLDAIEMDLEALFPAVASEP